MDLKKTMLRVAFYMHNDWALGSIHKALIKEFYKRGIDSNIIDWNVKYSKEEFLAFIDIYDVFVTLPGSSATSLLTCGVPYNKIIAIAHGRYDIQHGLSQGNDFKAFRGYGGVSQDLAIFSKSCDIDRNMTIVRNGINFNEFYRPTATELNVIGYAGVVKQSNHFANIKDWKRGHLVASVAEQTHTKLYVPSKRTHLAMSAYYENIDCLMVSSTEQESCGLPLLEAAAAGRLPISTLTGINRDITIG